MSLWDDILRMLGTNRIQVAWRWRAFRERLNRRARSVENRSRALRYEHQSCPRCGHPAAREDKTCTQCGARLLGQGIGRAARVVGLLVPEEVPLATMLVIAASVGLFLVTLKRITDLGADGTITARMAEHLVLVRFGAMPTDDPAWWTTITSMFLHFGIMHLGMNAVGIWVAGMAVEELFGRGKMLVAYVLTGIAGNLVAILWYQARGQSALSAGASGAAFGLIGVMVGHGLRFRGRVGREVRARFIPWALYGLLVGFFLPVNNAAHLGGLVAGMAFGALVGEARHGRPLLPRWVWTVAAIACVALCVVAFVLQAGQET